MEKTINKVLIANRGEIAIRVIRACYDMNLRTVAIYSKEDKYALFRTKADESYLIGENKSPLGAYLDIHAIINLAKRKGVDAIHPGYGFLSENPEFAKACEDAGIIFIGPPSDIINKMGDKINAKRIATQCGVPVIQGTDHPLESAQQAKDYAEQLGYPVILKAAAGGGGRGMRLVTEAEEMEIAFEMVQSESEKAFGSTDVFMEQYMEEPKHIEVQILADDYGNVVHLYERDCSVQRRYQKVVEFAPSINIPEDTRQALLADAVKIAKAVGYVNAGTVEFLVDKRGRHFFIEMNTRIQVEHTVTEMVTGIDIVQAQLDIAQGKALSDPAIGIASQDDVRLFGYSIQSRVTTEDPSNNFAPDSGIISVYRSGGGFGVRLDAGNAFAGAEITPYYDSLLVKITTLDRTFEGAIRKMLRAIGEIRIRGVKTNIAFLNNVLTHETFVGGNCHTKFIDETPELFDLKDSRDRATKVLKYIGKTILANPDRDNKPAFDAPRAPKYEDNDVVPDGIKQILDRDGPEKLSKWILDQKKLLITDTTMRDAHQSLLATRMRTKDMINIAPATAHILKDAFSLEMWGGATFDTTYRFLNECPWTRVEELRKEIPNIPFQMLFRGANAVGYSSYPDNLIVEFVRECAAVGIDIFRIFDSLNWIPNMELAIEEVIKVGKVANAAVCYTGNILDPKRDKYSLEYYVNFCKELEKRGAHIITIKDMSGLLRPYAAQKLISTLKNEIGVPIHLHTHDTSGNQIATLMLACEAGVDIVETAISSMGSLTSQPCMNSLVAALESTERDPGFDLQQLQKLTDYWADVREFYTQFEGDIKTPEAEIYRLEIPGGQYTNLKSQIVDIGLGDRFDEVKDKYVEVNEILGDIVKVTPSSKTVGDLAIFMVQNDLDASNIVSRGRDLSFPDSVVSYFMGLMGQPAFGFPEDLQEVVLKGETPYTGRPGEELAPYDYDEIRENLKQYLPNPTMRDAVSWCLYPKVFEDYLELQNEFGDLSNMDTHVYFMGMFRNEATEISIEDGKTLIVKYIGMGEENDDGTRTMQFELNGIRRDVTVEDKTIKIVAEQVVLADMDNKQHVGSGIPGAVSKVHVKLGDAVVVNQPLFVIEAMKMETSIVAKVDGEVSEMLVRVGQTVKAGELLAVLK
ncbi:MAG: pyruvate carboxylase [Oscillospiraceae bacterium]|nr:pyruvate carboxylase [Oscillospiraceae bacterium]